MNALPYTLPLNPFWSHLTRLTEIFLAFLSDNLIPVAFYFYFPFS